MRGVRTAASVATQRPRTRDCGSKHRRHNVLTKDERVQSTKLELRWSASAWFSCARAASATTLPCKSIATSSLDRDRVDTQEFSVSAMVVRRDPVTWTALIFVYAKNDKGKKSLAVYDKMSIGRAEHKQHLTISYYPAAVMLRYVVRYSGLPKPAGGTANRYLSCTSLEISRYSITCASMQPYPGKVCRYHCVQVINLTQCCFYCFIFFFSGGHPNCKDPIDGVILPPHRG
jgi:pentatricopeptide repeat protein